MCSFQISMHIHANIKKNTQIYLERYPSLPAFFLYPNGSKSYTLSCALLLSPTTDLRDLSVLVQREELPSFSQHKYIIYLLNPIWMDMWVISNLTAIPKIALQ